MGNGLTSFPDGPSQKLNIQPLALLNLLSQGRQAHFRPETQTQVTICKANDSIGDVRARLVWWRGEHAWAE